MKVAQLCLTSCNPMGCRLPGSSVHRILQARILEWVAVPFSRGSSWPRNQTGISSIVDGFFTIWATREAGDKNNALYGFILFICFDLKILKNSEEQCITVLLINSLSLSFKHTHVLGCHAGLASANLLPWPVTPYKALPVEGSRETLYFPSVLCLSDSSWGFFTHTAQPVSVAAVGASFPSAPRTSFKRLLKTPALISLESPPSPSSGPFLPASRWSLQILPWVLTEIGVVVDSCTYCSKDT